MQERTVAWTMPLAIRIEVSPRRLHGNVLLQTKTGENMTEEDEAFNHVEMMSKVKQEIIKNLPVKTQQEVYDELRNDVIEEVAQRFEKARDGCSPDDIMGRRWMDSAAELVRSMKK